MTNLHPTSVRVRFAPSPTGHLHIGGARTALFNYLFARRYRGAFLLRIEDTDVVRSDRATTEAIFSSLQWLDLNWDEEPLFQSSRIQMHKAACEEIVRLGKAYYCFCTPEELAQKRLVAQKEYKYDRTCMNLSAGDVQKKMSSGMPRAIRFRVPEGETVFRDRVRGNVAVQHREIDDFILLRSDGQPVYQVAVVVDDHDMRITHVIRGDDHLSNTPKQILLYQALGWDVPEFAHVPMILGPDKKRLSKRHGATSVEEYRKKGYLPQAIVNTLALIGWSPGDDREVLTLDEMAGAFSLEGISKNPGVFDEKKLEWVNGRCIHGMAEEALLEPVRRVLVETGVIGPLSAVPDNDTLLKVIGLLKERAKRMNDFAENGAYFFRDPDRYDEGAVAKFWSREHTGNVFPGVEERLVAATEWNAAALEKEIRGLAGEKGCAAAALIHPIRLALTGRATSPGLFEMMELLGRDTVLRRIRKAMQFLNMHSSGASGAS